LVTGMQSFKAAAGDGRFENPLLVGPHRGQRRFRIRFHTCNSIPQKGGLSRISSLIASWHYPIRDLSRVGVGQKRSARLDAIFCLNSGGQRAPTIRNLLGLSVKRCPTPRQEVPQRHRWDRCLYLCSQRHGAARFCEIGNAFLRNRQPSLRQMMMRRVGLIRSVRPTILRALSGWRRWRCRSRCRSC
jgi:hypothetical protein